MPCHTVCMRQKELRIALVCYGGISLAVYMHGVTKEIWKLARASRDFQSGVPSGAGSEQIYREIFERAANEHGVGLRFIPDILTGASAGGINAVFLAQAIHSGHSLEPLTDLWLDNADVDRLLDPKARLWTWVTKFWAPPVVELLLSRPGNVVSESVAPEMRKEVRHKLARFVRSRWFQPPFSGIDFSGLLYDAFSAMEAGVADGPLLPPGHPLELSVTVTDFHGYLQALRLNSPPLVEESEHRLPIGFRSRTPVEGGISIADTLELTLAARATASFPGAFPPLKLAEIDRLAETRSLTWDGREKFLQRVMPLHVADNTTESVFLVDGSVLVNAPFSEALNALAGRPSQREVDRRFVYIDPTPDSRWRKETEVEDVGFFKAILGSVSSIPREQPIRDNLELIQDMSREAAKMLRILAALRPEVERAVDRLFGRTFFLDNPTPKRLANWRAKAQQAAAEQAGYAFHSYAQAKFGGIIERLSQAMLRAAPALQQPDHLPIARRLRMHLEAQGLTSLANPDGGATAQAIAFFRAHDIGFRIRRLRLIARRLSRDWEDDPDFSEADLDDAREAIYNILSLYFAADELPMADSPMAANVEQVLEDPGKVLDALERQRDLRALDAKAEIMLSDALEAMPKVLRRKVLLAYLGFPFYDVATLPLFRNEGLTEFDPIKVDRISPDDASTIRTGGAPATLHGIEFYNFGAFFSRAYRENDYLWGRLHGAERMIDLICSTMPGKVDARDCRALKKRIFLAILDEEEERLAADPGLIPGLRREVEAL